MSLAITRGVACLLLSIGTSLVALRVRKWDTVPNVQTLMDVYKQKQYTDVLCTTAASMVKAVKSREQQNNNKARLIEYSWFLLIAGLSIVFTSIILSAAIWKL